MDGAVVRVPPRQEDAFSKVEQFPRWAEARTDDALRTATWAAFATLTAADLAGWFSHHRY
jgi:hypothetical protein